MSELAWSLFQTLWSFGFEDIVVSPYLLRQIDDCEADGVFRDPLPLLCSPVQFAAITNVLQKPPTRDQRFFYVSNSDSLSHFPNASLVVANPDSDCSSLAKALKSTRVRQLIHKGNRNDIPVEFECFFGVPSLLKVHFFIGFVSEPKVHSVHHTLLSQNSEFFNMLPLENEYLIDRCEWTRSNPQQPLSLSAVGILHRLYRTLSKNWLKMIGSAIERTPSLRHLHLQPCSYHSSQQDAYDELALGSSLESLNLFVGNGCDSQVAKLLPGLPQLTSLHLSSFSSSLDEMYAVLPRLPALKSLHFSPNYTDATKLVPVLPQLQLADLSLSNLDLTPFSPFPVFPSLSGLGATLRSLEFQSCHNLKLADLSTTISQLKFLDQLSLSNCRFWPLLTAESVRTFMAALSQTPIADLRVDHFSPQRDVFDAFVLALPSLTALHRLDFLDCSFSDFFQKTEGHWTQFFTVLSKCPKLNTLRVSSVPRVDCDLVALLPKTHLTQLFLLRSSDELELEDGPLAIGDLTPEQLQVIEACSQPDWLCSVSFCH
jgi:hypothetical protein